MSSLNKKSVNVNASKSILIIYCVEYESPENSAWILPKPDAKVRIGFDRIQTHHRLCSLIILTSSTESQTKNPYTVSNNHKLL